MTTTTKTGRRPWQADAPRTPNLWSMMSNPSIPPKPQLRNYTRWTQVDGHALEADILGVRDVITAYPDHGHVTMGDRVYTPDEARMVGVRLIEGAALADGERAIRQASSS